MPPTRPRARAAALLPFFSCWNGSFGSQIHASENPGRWTLSYGPESCKDAHQTDRNLTTAATVLVMTPVLVVFFFARKAFIEGGTLTGGTG